MPDRPPSFVHCHVHTEFSILDGASRVGEVVEAAAADGQPALAITDHGNMYGALPFYGACKGAGITPIIGTEAYMAHERRDERINTKSTADDGDTVDGGRKAMYHLTLLAASNEGYANLIKLSSRSFLEGYYRKGRVDWELLADHAGGLLATTGCLGGHVPQALVRGAFDEALEKAARLQDIFGRGNLFVELQDHGIPDQIRVMPQLVEIARRLGAPLLATNDSHYTRPDDAKAHDALLCVQTKTTIDKPGRFRFQGTGHYLKSAAEMRQLFSEFPDACDNTLLVAERADVTIEFGKPKLPRFPIPEGFATDAEYLRHLAFEGEKRWGEPLPDEVAERLAFELRVIEDMGFPSYFLIVWDLIRHAKESGIRVGPGRGSAAGCAVAYCLRITELDPIRYDLLFERFLNPSRVSMPDIDMDFDSRYRDEMIRYAVERYGRDHVAQIITFGTIKARASVRDAARVLGYPYSVGDRIAKAMPPVVMGRDTPLWACMAEAPPAGQEDGWKVAAELRQMARDEPEVARVVHIAEGLEGLCRQDGIHAAAVVITRDPLTDYLPIQRKPDPNGDPEDAPIVTQYEMHGVEELGLLKMDFLGLRNLDVISDTVALLERTRGIDLDIDAAPLGDAVTFEMLRRGDSIGIFQLEGTEMRKLMRSLVPSSLEDVSALIALYRPGPMAANMHRDFADRKNGRQAVKLLHPDAEAILSDTFGLMIYQEKLMRVAQQFAGYSLAEADNLRKACLAEGTLFSTADGGEVPIEKLMELGFDRVLTCDPVQGWATFAKFAKVEDVWSVGLKPVLRLATSSGHTIEATHDHRFFTKDGWTQLQHLAVDDAVASVGSIGLEVVWDTVVAIETAGERECFDFQMEDHELPQAFAHGLLVHNCGKKIREVMRAEREKFVSSVESNGYSRELGEQWFDIIEPFADYAFCKAHAYGYGLIAYQTAYLKANYPTEYFAALLTSVREKLDRAGIYLAECRRLGITVEVPDVNSSGVDFTPVSSEEGRRIIFGISAVRGVGPQAGEAIVAEREGGGEFKDFYDFCERVPIPVLNKGTMDALIRAGAFDSLGYTRRGLCTAHEEIASRVITRRRERDQGVLSLFGGGEGGVPIDAPITIPDWEFERTELLSFEKQMLGLYVSDHPLRGIEVPLKRRCDASVAELSDVPDGSVKTVGGVVTNLVTKWTKRGDQMVVFTLEGTDGAVEATVFSRVLTTSGEAVRDDNVVLVKGKVERREDAVKIIVMEMESFIPPEHEDAVVFVFPPHRADPETIAALKEVLLAHPGNVPVQVCTGNTRVRLPAQFSVASLAAVAGLVRATIPDVDVRSELPTAEAS